MKKLIPLLFLVPFLGFTACDIAPEKSSAGSAGYSTPEKEGIYYETPQSVIHSFRFEENRLYWDTENKAAFGPRKQNQITGTY